MSRVRLKICGVRTTAEVVDAVEAGADALGFNFHPPSPRAISLRTARELAAAVPLWVDKVALVVEPEEDFIRAASEALGTRTVQLYAPASVALLERLADLQVILGLPVCGDETLDGWPGRAANLAAALLDAAGGVMPGGTGRTVDWSMASRVRRELAPLPVVLAGGLRADNVARAIAAVRPYAVDVASGVESSPGVKDRQMMRDFAAAVWSVEQ